MTARFISFEGIDGAGKSTHIATLTARLEQRGATVINTREPGGTELAETLRELVLHSSMDDHLQQVIQPALDAGKTVLCDRFTDASFAYQGGGRGVDLTVLGTLEKWVQGDRQPDLTLWFDLPPEMAAQRRAAARTADRFEQQDLDFFERVRAAYARRAEAAPQRFVRLDASLSVDAVAAQIAAVMESRGW